MSKERVVLIHSYLADREDSQKPDRLSRLGILAASELYRREKVDKICITVEPNLSAPQVRRLNALLRHPPEEDIIVRAQTVTTREEVETFRDLAKGSDWGELTTIGNSAHLPRIKKEVERSFKKRLVNVRDAKEILAQYPRYDSVLSETENWPEQKSLVFQERVLGVPILGETLLKLAPYLSHYKVALQSWFFKRIEDRHK
jgi:hypothetical protein